MIRGPSLVHEAKWHAEHTAVQTLFFSRILKYGTRRTKNSQSYKSYPKLNGTNDCPDFVKDPFKITWLVGLCLNIC